MPEPNDVTIVKGGAERIDDLEPIWKALQDHHVALTPSLAGLERRLPDDSWAAARRSYAEWLRDPDTFLLIAEQAGRPVGYALVTLGKPYWGWASGERVADVDRSFGSSC